MGYIVNVAAAIAAATADDRASGRVDNVGEEAALRVENRVPEIAAAAHAADRAVMLGAYTPTEAQLAHEAGSDFIKIFPADGLGPAYIKAIRAPLPHLRIVPTGGVDLHNIRDFIQAGCAAVGVGSTLVSRQILADADWPALTALAAKFVEAIRQARTP